ncbi:MAG: hypothetical protein ACRDIY_23420 [Chloroflexota bacterium]
MSPGRFHATLRTQVQVSQDDFWETLLSGRPVLRPSEPPPRVSPAIPARLACILLDSLKLSENDAAGLSEEVVRRMIAEFRSRAGPGRFP